MRSTPLPLPLALASALAMGASLCGCVTSTNVSSNQAVAGGGFAPARPAPARVVVLRQAPHVVVVASGTRTQLASFLSLNADCSLAAYYTVRLVVPPAHGTASIGQGRFYPNYPPNNPHAVCNNSPGEGIGLSYRSAPGYLGPDFLEVQAISPGGRAQLLDNHLDVR